MTYPDRQLGRRPPKNAPALRLANVLTGTVPVHPASVDHFSEIADWLMLANDRFADCGPAAVAHQRMLMTRYLTATSWTPTLPEVFDLYRRSGNPDFDPATGAGDNGVDMQTMCEALVAGGIGGVKALAFAKVNVSSLDEVRAAVAIFGSLLLGVTLETAQRVQTGRRLWDYAPSSTWGGHAVLTGRYTSAKTGDDLAVVTWGDIVGTTDSFWLHQVEEAWVVIWSEHLGQTEFQAGVDVAALASDYFALTGRPFPGAHPAPPPVPAPSTVDVADRALAAALRPWVTEHHVGANHHTQVAAQAWLTAKGL